MDDESRSPKSISVSNLLTEALETVDQMSVFYVKITTELSL